MGFDIMGLGDALGTTASKVVDRLADRYLPEQITEKEKEEFRVRARELLVDEYKTAIADVQGARQLAADEAEGTPGWTRILTVTHRPVWSFLVLGVFCWTALAPYFGFESFPLTEVHESIIQTVIVFYFGGRSIEKTVGMFKG